MIDNHAARLWVEGIIIAQRITVKYDIYSIGLTTIEGAFNPLCCFILSITVKETHRPIAKNPPNGPGFSNVPVHVNR